MLAYDSVDGPRLAAPGATSHVGPPATFQWIGGVATSGRTRNFTISGKPLPLQYTRRRRASFLWQLSRWTKLEERVPNSSQP